ncbi:protein smoothened isoform X1 [Onthophagus taurus]|uniref:protein smoothened isoform X1 n=1 Tax=Onthophagus taurus TaxID=166361 RepID=UPI0039BDB09F
MKKFWISFCVFFVLITGIFTLRIKRRLKVNPHNLEYCKRPAKCEILNVTTCLGTKLPYGLTSLSHTGLNGEEQVVERLNLFKNSIYLPRCWPIIQPFLCAHFVPKCENDFVYLPSNDMCKSAEKLCSTFYNLTGLDFDCEDSNLFPHDCKNYIVDLNTTKGVCITPLIKTDQDESFYSGIDGCGLSCKDPFYTQIEHKQIHKLIGYCVFLCLFLTLFTVCTFIIDWKTANKYPALAVFYINICFLVSYSGWMIQFLGTETREDIVCKRDGTLRKSEPRATENLSCVIVFVMVYYFLIAGMVWFVIFTYCWYMGSLQALGTIQERVDKKKAYFHLVAWSLPLMLTITTMALGEIDGDYTSGICFVGCLNSAARAGMLLAPLGVAISLGGYIIIRGLILLIRVKIESREIISVHSSRKIRSNIMRMGIFALLMVLFTIITFVYFAYRTTNIESWNESLYKYIKCKIQTPIEDHNCKLDSRPSLAMLQLQLIAVFGSGIAMASWTWCAATVHSWTRYIRSSCLFRKFNCELEEPMKLQKHKIIALAFAKREKFKQDGRISIERQNSDPVGLNFELNSEVSTTWAKNLPRLVTRRGAVPNDVIYSYTSSNQSIDSEMSFSVRHVSIESRRNSTDSQVSVKIAELKATRKAKGRMHRYTRHKPKTSREIGRKLSKTSSSSKMKIFQPNMGRRTAISGLDGQHINDLLSNGKLVIPYNLNIDSLSEDENVSVSISESRFNMVLSNNLDLNDHLAMKSLRQGLKIEELKTTSDDSECSKKDYDQEKRESRGSKRSKYSKRSKIQYSSDSDDDSDNNRRSESSSCPELKQLVQSSLNSGASMGCSEKNRGSKQSKRSIDVAVQANAKEIMTQTAAYELPLKSDEKKHKTKQAKMKENKYKKEGRSNEKVLFEKIRRSKEKYKDYGSENEKVMLNV